MKLKKLAPKPRYTGWKKDYPTEDGWYWVRYRGKHGMCRCPASVMVTSKDTYVRTARSDFFAYSLRKQKGMSDIRFGPKIEEP